ncbi:hypothetical protein PMKS-000381 [Pichia membranifaciens]|uniref:Condensin complex subunit 2 n=1 Tax=Pichia membranifaciens TaxID=4926 RepID=A0A1Q2YBL2_9ASCO|nr:hypothetical protein PMKS-000381 [Pichia membranifaciens]
MAGPYHGSKRHRSPSDAPRRKRVPSSELSVAKYDSKHVRIGNKNEEKDDDDDDENLMVLSKEDFENAIKLVTNNKINNVNTWEVKLIDYFYDMNHLKSDDGVSINFQMASATLDGCTKVISKRVDSVGVDTDALIQILAINNDSKSRKKKSRGEDDEDDDNQNDPDYQGSRKSRQDKTTKEAEKFISIDKLKFNDRHIQFATIDPVFRKMLADFDEGGAKSLLLSSLRMSHEGRVIFDDTTTASSVPAGHDIIAPGDSTVKRENSTKIDGQLEEHHVNATNADVDPKDEEMTVDLLDMYHNVVRDPKFNSLDICKVITEIKNSIEDVEYGKQFVNIINQRMEEDEKMKTNLDPPEFNVEYDYDIDNFDLNHNNTDITNNFNVSEVTNLSLRNSSANPENYELYNDNGFDDNEPSLNEEEVIKKESILMAELDKMPTVRRRQHWKIRAINSNPRIVGDTNRDSIFSNNEGDQSHTAASNLLARKYKSIKEAKKNKKNGYTIDFMNDSTDTDTSILFKKATRPLKSLNPDQINSDRTTLPDLKSWSSERLVKSLLKPKRRLRNVFTKRTSNSASALYADRNFWAAKYNDKITKQSEEIDQDAADFLYEVMDKPSEEDTDSIVNNDNAADEFGGSFDPGVYDFDAPIHDQQSGSNGQTGNDSQVPGSSGTEIIKASRSSWHTDSIHFEKRSKKINVRLLKQNLWNITQQHATKTKNKTSSMVEKEKANDMKLSDIVKDTYKKYEGREKSDLSTSFFFICMLHIANEEGLYIEKTDDLSDIIIHT